MGALYWMPGTPAAEAGKVQMGNVSIDKGVRNMAREHRAHPYRVFLRYIAGSWITVILLTIAAPMVGDGSYADNTMWQLPSSSQGWTALAGRIIGTALVALFVGSGLYLIHALAAWVWRRCRPQR